MPRNKHGEFGDFLSSEDDVEQQPANFAVQVIGRENVTLKEMQILRIVIVEKKKCPGRAANRFRQIVSLPTYGTLHIFHGFWLQTDRN